MASIISSSVIFDRVQADSTRLVRVKFVAEDHDANQFDVFVGPRQVAADFNVSDWMAAHESSVLEQLAAQEDAGGLDLNVVANPLTYAQNPKWSTEKSIAKTMIYWMMRERDPRIVIYLEPLITYLKTNYTVTQLANFLGITEAQVLKMNNRVNAILTDSGTFEVLLAVFDVEEEEF